MSSQPKVLFVLTSHGQMGNTGKPTGWYLPEFAHPYHVLSKHAQITIASPAGGASPLDPSSVEASKDDEISVNFHKNNEKLWKETEKLENFVGKAGEYDAIFFVGGHGPMFDLATSPTSHKIINEFASANKIVSAVCHGPAALAYVKTSSGSYLLDGHAVTGFSNTEEDAVQLTSAMPFKLEDQLNTASGGKYEKAGADWGEKVVVSGRIITGQNPASACAVGEAILKAVQK
ncbi:related to NonF protein, involved in nonactin biosynthesis [Rhynchosporium secalis]|uniref:D-lactate dehydratase n=1 Tax=Rhynchosporium secalis TaxID=38038 RepID=A0A1E1M7E5_RHYSE|nr:related to NonF protein, involved in nonactin biosynthesis [Rhynchosporium secalis]